MKGLILNEGELKEIDNYIQDLPLKYGLPLLNYINQKIKEQSQVKEILEEVKENS